MVEGIGSSWRQCDCSNEMRDRKFAMVESMCDRDRLVQHGTGIGRVGVFWLIRVGFLSAALCRWSFFVRSIVAAWPLPFVALPISETRPLTETVTHYVLPTLKTP